MRADRRSQPATAEGIGEDGTHLCSLQRCRPHCHCCSLRHHLWPLSGGSPARWLHRGRLCLIPLLEKAASSSWPNNSFSRISPSVVSSPKFPIFLPRLFFSCLETLNFIFIYFFSIMKKKKQVFPTCCRTTLTKEVASCFLQKGLNLKLLGEHWLKGHERGDEDSGTLSFCHSQLG